MSDERVYEVWHLEDTDGQILRFCGNLTVTGWHMGHSLEELARERDLPAGEYRLMEVDDSRVVGSTYVYALVVRTEIVVEAAPAGMRAPGAAA